jgi:cyclic peptide transporter
MEVIKFFYRYNKTFSIVFILLTIVSGLLGGGVIAFINYHIEELGKENYQLDVMQIVIFVGLITLHLSVSWFVSAGVTRYSMKMIHNIRMQIIEKLKKIEYRAFEKVGDEHIFTILIRDTATISNSSSGFVYFFSSIVTIVFCLGYMLWLFPMGFLLTMVVLAIGMGVYLLNQKKIIKKLTEARELEAVFYKQVEDFVKGFKEIKISKEKKNDIFNNYIYRTSDKVMTLNITSLIGFLNNSIIGQGFFYVLMGFILFYFPMNSNGGVEKVITYLFLIIYMLGPISRIAEMVPTMSFVKIAIKQLRRLEFDILSIKNEFDFEEAAAEKPFQFKEIRFEEVYFTYDNEREEEQFTLGPINISIESGKTHLIFGENGGGKSTFMKVFSGLYKPNSGNIYIDDHRLDYDEYDYYRNQFCAVYSEFYLFDTLYGLKNIDENRLETWLRKMKIFDKVSLEGDKLSTINLSSGQRKRLALVIALMENKPIMILDEWAAEQDPDFKKIFYHEILPELGSDNRTVVLISHDDKYFDCSERIFRISNAELCPIEKEEFA